HGDAEALREAVVALERRLRAALARVRLGPRVELERRRARPDHARHLGQDLADDAARLAHLRELGAGLRADAHAGPRVRSSPRWAGARWGVGCSAAERRRAQPPLLPVKPS